MHARHRSRFRGRNLPSTFAQEMASYGASDAWDFTTQTYIRGGVLAPSGITFTRASSGYAETSDGRLVEFASGAPRITDLGLLIEDSRQNIILRSTDWTVSPWVNVSGGTASLPTLTANAGVAPDGTTTATRIQFSLNGGTTTSDNVRRRQVRLTTAGTKTFSFYVRSFDGITNYQMLAEDANGMINPISVTGNWKRFVITSTYSAVNTAIGLGIRGGQTPVNSDSADVLAWVAQLEDGGNASSPIKTEGSAVTRAADVANVESLAISGEHSLLIFKGASSAVANETLLQLDDGSTDNRSLLYRNTTGRILTDSGGVNQADQAIGSWATVAQRYAVRIATDDVRGALNGTLGTADTSATLPAGTLTTLRLGQNATGNALNGYLRRVALFASGLTDEQLQGITL